MTTTAEIEATERYESLILAILEQYFAADTCPASGGTHTLGWAENDRGGIFRVCDECGATPPEATTGDDDGEEDF